VVCGGYIRLLGVGVGGVEFGSDGECLTMVQQREKLELIKPV
jgi:hypothetical protein